MDLIEHLQTDDCIVTDKDTYIINTIFTHEKKQKSYHVKHIVIASVLFLLLSLPRLDELIESVVKTSNIYIKLAIKTVFFFFFYFLMINYIVKY
jgi:hypothetical protein